MKFETCPWKKDEPHIVSMHCGETLLVRLLDNCGGEVAMLTVGTLLFSGGSTGMSVAFPPAKTLYRDQRGRFVTLDYDAAVRMEFDVPSTPEYPSGRLILERVTHDVAGGE